MSLDTILTIGKALRESDNWIKHFRYANPINTTEPIFCISIPVKENFIIDWRGVVHIPENKRDRLYSSVYKTSNQDGSATKYVYGDIIYSIGKGKETGNYRIEKNAWDSAQKTVREELIEWFIPSNTKKKSRVKQQIISALSSELDDEEVISIFQEHRILSFWKMFCLHKKTIERCLRYAPVFNKTNFEDEQLLKREYAQYLLEERPENLPETLKKGLAREDVLENVDEICKYANHSVFIHFDFEGMHWYEVEDLFHTVIDFLKSKITRKQDGGIVFTKSIFHRLCSGDVSNDRQFPLFLLENSYKSFCFRKEEDLDDFLYTKSILKQPFRWLYGTNKKGLYVFPRSIGKKISCEAYESFFFRDKNEFALATEEFNPSLSFIDDTSDDFLLFDVVFSDKSGKTIIDLMEISGLSKSSLLTIRKRIEDCENQIAEKRKEYSNWESGSKMYFEQSIANLLGQTTIDTKKQKVVIKIKVGKRENYEYTSYLLRTLPMIYTNSYYQDPILLGKLIEKVEFSVRNNPSSDEKKSGSWDYSNFHLLKYDLMLLYSIRNKDNQFEMEILQSESYQIGLLLGLMARNLKREIKSFEKNYVGTLTRRIGTLQDLICFKNDVVEKLVLHDQMEKVCKFSCELDQKIKVLKERYDKEICAFGFFESYFSYNNSNKETSEKKGNIQ